VLISILLFIFIGGSVDCLKGEIVYSFIYENWTQTLKICKLL